MLRIKTDLRTLFDDVFGSECLRMPHILVCSRYNILHFKQVSRGNFAWIHVGQYQENQLTLDMSQVQFRFETSRKSAGSADVPLSVCSLPCSIGQAKKFIEGEENCCFHCFK